MNRIATYYRLTPPPPTVSFAALLRGGERYVFVWDSHPESLRGVLRACGKFASDPYLAFTWYDAAIISNRVRSMKCT